MKILVDSSYPLVLNGLANSEGLELVRVSDDLRDSELISKAAYEGFRAVLLLDQEILASESLQDLAKELDVVLICSVDNDPLEAEVNFRHALSTVADSVRNPGGAVFWLGRKGLHIST